MKKLISLLLTLVMVMSLVACSGGPSDSTNPPSGNTGAPAPDGSKEPVINFDEDPYEVSIQFVGLFESNTNIANVEAALNEITLKKINCTVDIVPVFIGDLPTTTSMGVAGGEKLDIVTVGLTSGITNMVSDELLLPLDDLLAERGQAALEVTKNVAEAQKINGVTYAVTGYPFAALAGGFVYNKTMADEYGIEMHDGMSIDELTAVGEVLKEHGVPLTFLGNSAMCNYKFWRGGDMYGSTSEYGGILDPVNSTEIVNVYDTQELRDFWKLMKTWNDSGFLSPGQLTDTTTVQEYFMQGKVFGTSTSYTLDQLGSWKSPNFESGIVRTSDATISTGGVTEFMLGIAANCERPDKAMDLINLIYSDPEVCNLLQYGIEGTDYAKVEGTENVITYEGTPNADHNSYYAPFVQFGSQLNRKAVTPLTDSYYDELVKFENSASKSAAFGYTFDSSEFTAESGAISNVLQERLPMLNAGEVDDVDKAVDELVAALKTAGIDDVIAANQEQLNAFLGK